MKVRRFRPGSAASSIISKLRGQLADDRVVEALGAGLVQPHVVVGPAGAELLAAGGELADEVDQITVVWVAAGLSS